jgi:hypothetical protein
VKGWESKGKRRRVAQLGRAWMTDDEKLVRLHSLLTCLKNIALVVQGVYGHVWSVEARRVMHDEHVPGHPLAHSGIHVPRSARACCPDTL